MRITNSELKLLGSRLDLSGSRDVIGHVIIRLAIGHFLLMVVCNQSFTSNGFRDIQWSMTECDAMVHVILIDL